MSTPGELDAPHASTSARDGLSARALDAVRLMSYHSFSVLIVDLLGLILHIAEACSS
jgi:hypothetical protein